MSVNITESKVRLIETKEIYEEFKFFKNIYTKINFTDEIILIGNAKEKCVDIAFKFDTKYFKMYGKLYGNTHFLKWLQKYNKVFKIEMKKLIELGKTLKKNVDGVEYDEDYFVFQYKKDDIVSVLRFKGNHEEMREDIFDVNFDHHLVLDSSYLEHDIFQMFEKDGEPTKERTKDKIIEIPRDRIFSIIKNSEVELSYTNKGENGTRLIKIESFSNDLNLRLIQFFRTI